MRVIYYLVKPTAKSFLDWNHYLENLERSLDYFLLVDFQVTVHILTDCPDDLASIESRYEFVVLENIENSDRPFMYKRMEAQLAFLEKNNFEDAFGFFDVDTVINTSLINKIPKNKLVFLTRKDSKYPINGGCLLGGVNSLELAKQKWKQMLRLYDGLSDELKEWYGDQEVLKRVMLNSSDDQIMIDCNISYFEPRYSLSGWFSFARSQSDVIHCKGVSQIMLKFAGVRYGSFIKRLSVHLRFVSFFIFYGRSYRHKFNEDTRR